MQVGQSAFHASTAQGARREGEGLSQSSGRYHHAPLLPPRATQEVPPRARRTHSRSEGSLPVTRRLTELRTSEARAAWSGLFHAPLPSAEQRTQRGLELGLAAHELTGFGGELPFLDGLIQLAEQAGDVLRNTEGGEGWHDGVEWCFADGHGLFEDDREGFGHIARAHVFWSAELDHPHAARAIEQRLSHAEADVGRAHRGDPLLGGDEGREHAVALHRRKHRAPVLYEVACAYERGCQTGRTQLRFGVVHADDGSG